MAAAGELYVNYASNFKLTGFDTMVTDPVILSRPDVRFDLRTRMLTYDFDPSTMDWYFNYIDSIRHFAVKNPDVYAQFLLDAGYVPVIYLPIDTTDSVNRQSICLKWHRKLLSALMKSKFPYVSLAVTTFTPHRIQYGNITDAWVSKMDAAAILNKAPETITADDVIKEVLKYVGDDDVA